MTRVICGISNSENVEAKPSLGHYSQKRGEGQALALDRLRLNESAEAFFRSIQK